MDFKLFVAVFCLASIQVSEAALTWSASTGTATTTECVNSATVITYTPNTVGAASAAAVVYNLQSQTPDSNPKKFSVVSASGALSTLTSTTSTLDATTQSTYDVVIRATEAADVPELTLTVTITDTGCSSSASFVFPSFVVMLISLFSLLMKNNN